MIKNKLNLLCIASLLLLSGCSTIGSLAGAAIAVKAGENALLGSLVGGAAGQVVGSVTGQVASGAAGQVF
ncbi:MAG: hypothetical protein KAG34_09000 [Cocleimonas sp.]|nr:hypothetical protein [Cocleimonas sp.]